MKVLVYVFYTLVFIYSNMNLRAITWNDLITDRATEVCSLWYSKEEFNDTLYATETANVRTQPKKSSTKLGYLQSGDSIEVTAITDNDWYEVSYQGKRGYVKTNYLKKTYSASPIKYDSVFYYVGNVSKKDIIRVANNWVKIPESIRESFINDGSKIIVTNEHLGLKFHNDLNIDILGITSFSTSKNNCEIYIANNENASASIIHEIGHYMDGKLGFPSNTDDFKELWSCEMQFISTFHVTNLQNVDTPSEYFAETCNLYIIKNEDLKNYCPMTYEYISKCFKEMS